MYQSPLEAPPPGSPAPTTPPAATTGSPNYYSPPAFDYQPIPTYDAEQSAGSYGLGIVAGLVFSLIGLIVAAIFGKAQTRRGALHGFLVRMGITFLIIVVSFATH